MCTKILYLAFFVLLLGSIGSASAAVYWDDGDPCDSDWDSPNNWNPNGVPNSTAYALININTTCLINTGMTAECNDLIVSDMDSDAILDIDGGTLTISNYLIIGRLEQDSNGTIDMDGGTVTVENVTVARSGVGLFDLAGGTVNVNNSLKIGPYGLMNIAGGTLKITGDANSQIIDLIEDEALIAQGGSGRVRFDYNITNAGKTTVTGETSTDHNWNNGAAGDSNWSNLNNWVEDEVPGVVDTVYINIADSNCQINTGTNAVCDGLEVGKDTGTCYLNVKGGTLKVSVYTAPRNFVIGNRPSATGVVNLSGGTANVAADMLVGFNGTGTLNVSGGTLNIDGKLLVPAGVGTGTVNLTGGTINAGANIANAGLDVKAGVGGTGTINITAGTLVINGDATARIKEYMAKGYLTAYGGRGKIVYNYNVTHSGKTTVTATADNNIAYSPDPAAGDSGVSSSVTLKWAKGNSVADTNGHDIFIGSSFDDVNDANTGSSEYKSTRDSNSYTPTGLVAGEKYYWRVDEVNDAASHTWKGNVWCFKVSEPNYVRQKITFNQDWKFRRGDVSGANGTAYDDYTWDDVALPHHPKIDPMWAPYYNLSWQGYHWYRKHFTLPNSYYGKKIFLEFESGSIVSSVWVNGTYMKAHYGQFLPFTIDITSVANFGTTENVIAVELDNYENDLVPGAGTWYIYGGLYRDIWMHVTDKLHVTDAVDANVTASGGTFVTFSDVSSSSATIQVKTHVKNEYASAKTCKVRNYLFDPNGDLVDPNDFYLSDSYSISASGTHTFTLSDSISDICLWTPENPYLYTVWTEVYDDNTLVDRVDTKIGIKKVSFAHSTGFKLNDVSRKLRGTNRSQDWAYIGMAMSNFGQKTHAIKMKKGGMEYMRSSHFQMDPTFLDTCDELGIAVMDEVAPSGHYWSNDPIFVSRAYEQITDMMRRDRNHACVIAWELSMSETQFPTSYAENAVSIGHTEYPGSYISGWKNDGVYDIFVTTPHHAPGRDYSGSAALIISEYGHWDYGGTASTSDVHRGDGEANLLQQAFNHQEAHNLNRGVSDLCADGVWIFNDYGTYESGLIDRVGLPKFSYYFYQSQRDPNVTSVADVNLGPMVYIANYWKSDSTTNVTVYSNCDQVKLYINDVNQGIRSPNTDGNCTNIAQPPFTFTGLTYSAGELKAEGLIGGVVKATHVVKTPASANKLSVVFDTEGQTVYANGEDMFFVHASVLDANNVVVSDANNTVTFSVTGPAILVYPTSVDAEAGIASVLVRTLTEPGTITVTATASGLTSGSSSITSAAYYDFKKAYDTTTQTRSSYSNLYEEQFTVASDSDVNAVGWRKVLNSSSTAGIESDSPKFAWVYHNADCENIIDTNEYTVDVSEYAAIRFKVDLRKNSNYTKTPEVSITVKVGGTWYVSKTKWTNTTTTFVTKTLDYTTDKNDWDTLDRATAARGSTAGSDLSGDISEFGLHSDSSNIGGTCKGTAEYDNFKVQGISYSDLYEEQFTVASDSDVNAVGWRKVLNSSSTAGIESDSPKFAWVYHKADCENIIDTNEYTVDVSEYAAIRFKVDLRKNSYYTTTPEVSITVKVGGTWYVSKTKWTNTTTTFVTKTLDYTTDKNNWDTLNRATAARGSTAGSDLSGDISEFGLHSDSSNIGGTYKGTAEYDNFNVEGEVYD